MLLADVAYSQSIIGKWKTIDDKTQTALSVIEIYEKDNKYDGKLLEILNILPSHANCEKCAAKIKNKSLLGKEVILDLKQSNPKGYKGKLIDPFSDKSYSCTIKMISNTTIQVTAHMGLPVFGRTQHWVRITEKK